MLQRTSSVGIRNNNNNNITPRQNGLLSFIADRADGSLECTYGKECDGGCIPDWAQCCDFGGGGWCEPDLRCQKSNLGCCELDSNDCIGPGYDCENDDEKICGEFCVPEDSVCCDSGFYCEAGEQCTATGCIPEGAVSCGDGEFCGEGEECADDGCAPEEEEPFGVVEGACEDDEATVCDHTITASRTASTGSSSTSEMSEAESTSASAGENDDDNDDEASETEGDSVSESDTPDENDDDDDDDDAAISLRGGITGVIVMAVFTILLT